MFKLKEFQSNAIDKVVSLLNNNKEEIVIQSPTGSGKTILLSFAIKNYLKSNTSPHCFFWFSPGNGELEEQSKDKFSRLVPEYDALSLDEAIRNGFGENQVVFVNWEMLDKSGNRALREQETKNLKDRIEECRKNGTDIIIIKDESHTHNTKIAEGVLDLFGDTQKIKVSATVNRKIDPNIDIEITEEEVIRSGLITKLISINEGISKVQRISGNEEEILLGLAIEKQKEIAKGYKKVGLDLIPLVIIQYPNETNKKEAKESSARLMKRVEDYLASKGFSYDNGLCACWLDGNKKNIDGDNQPAKDVIFLHTKQALATGWDCPRAKILIKLRDNMNETFEIQVLGRIRRMPEQKHYDDDVLNNCYLYTFDEKYKEAAISSYGGKEAKILYLKDEYKALGLNLYKQIRNDSVHSELDDKKKVKLVCDYIISHYDLEDVPMSSSDKSGYGRNKAKLEKIGDGEGYIFKDEIAINTFEGNVSYSTDLLSDEMNKITIYQDVDEDILNAKYNNTNWVIAKATGLSDAVIRAITQSLFQFERTSKKRRRNRIGRVLNFSKKEYRTFVVNNKKQLIEDIRKARYAHENQVKNKPLSVVKIPFKIPEKDIVYLEPTKSVSVIEENVYDDYTTDIIRSLPEKRFEAACQKCGHVQWFYKNGDKGQRYFSIAYRDNFGKTSLFYPDYLLMTNDERLFIIEAKGGESSNGESRNIDKNTVEKKFDALKSYVELHNLTNFEHPIYFAFVRDVEHEDELGNKTHQLYYDNTTWTEKMDVEWKPFENLF